jgi:hypothetical protein
MSILSRRRRRVSTWDAEFGYVEGSRTSVIGLCLHRTAMRPVEGTLRSIHKGADIGTCTCLVGHPQRVGKRTPWTPAVGIVTGALDFSRHVLKREADLVPRSSLSILMIAHNLS